MNELQKAKQWFLDRGIDARINDDGLYIQIQEYEVLVSTSEVMYRAELLDEELIP